MRRALAAVAITAALLLSGCGVDHVHVNFVSESPDNKCGAVIVDEHDFWGNTVKSEALGRYCRQEDTPK